MAFVNIYLLYAGGHDTPRNLVAFVILSLYWQVPPDQQNLISSKLQCMPQLLKFGYLPWLQYCPLWQVRMLTFAKDYHFVIHTALLLSSLIRWYDCPPPINDVYSHLMSSLRCDSNAISYAVNYWFSNISMLNFSFINFRSPFSVYVFRWGCFPLLSVCLFVSFAFIHKVENKE